MQKMGGHWSTLFTLQQSKHVESQNQNRPLFTRKSTCTLSYPHSPLPLPCTAPTSRPKSAAPPERNAPSPAPLAGAAASPSGCPRRAHDARLRQPRPRAAAITNLGLMLPLRLFPPLSWAASAGGSEGRPRLVVMEVHAITMEGHPKDRVTSSPCTA
jgi:hypothetical protein